ncbi:hypothetical protein L1987_39698 [Smallanthus sonchifolius]|uniref:Uncharacterized protein n=1 Tax=Smallanthus sonchifolius TaxID=185202 RepID=A0ACB9HMJ2_9ASTR|nr:hypothetical protein L1987_39698 [Smallanthus sonchifolius]
MTRKCTIWVLVPVFSLKYQFSTAKSGKGNFGRNSFDGDGVIGLRKLEFEIIVLGLGYSLESDLKSYFDKNPVAIGDTKVIKLNNKRVVCKHEAYEDVLDNDQSMKNNGAYAICLSHLNKSKLDMLLNSCK